jgi:hypothetical protein
MPQTFFARIRTHNSLSTTLLAVIRGLRSVSLEGILSMLVLTDTF